MGEKMTADEFETLCLVNAIADGCTLMELTARLGLSASLTEVVRDAVESLESRGVVAMDGESIRTFGSCDPS